MLILFSQFAVAVVVDQLGTDLSTQDTDTGSWGHKIVARGNYILVSAAKNSNTDVQRCDLHDAALTLLANNSFVGDVCTLNYQMTANATYYIVGALNNYGTFTRRYKVPGYPVAGTNINFTSGCRINGGLYCESGAAGNGFTFQNITTDTPSETAPPNIVQNTYNMTSDGGCTNWQTNTSSPCPTTDTTPTIKFTTDEDANCRIGKTDSNYTALGTTRNCTTTGSTSHVCTLISGDALSGGAQNIYVGCADLIGNENITSTSGALALSVAYTMRGNVKEQNGVNVENATILIHFMNNTYLGNTSTDVNGNWNYTLLSDFYMISAFDKKNISRGGAIAVNVSVP